MQEHIRRSYEHAQKRYVDVVTHIKSTGEVRPLALIIDGRKINIDRIRQIRRAASRLAGGFGLRYDVFADGKDIQLYDEEGRWFIPIGADAQQGLGQQKRSPLEE